MSILQVKLRPLCTDSLGQARLVAVTVITPHSLQQRSAITHKPGYLSSIKPLPTNLGISTALNHYP